MYKLEAACNDAQRLLDVALGLSPLSSLATSSSNTSQLQYANALPGPSSASSSSATAVEIGKKSRGFNIYQRLRELYLEECRTPISAPTALRTRFKRGSRLLEKLVERDNLNTLILNLYPGNIGYTLSLRLRGKVPTALGNQAGRSQGSEQVLETMRWPYSDEELLRCVDREELPHTLTDLLEVSDHAQELFYNGAVIAEVRDHRPHYPHNDFVTHFVLLRPTTQSIINDVMMMSSANDLTSEERLSLERQMVQMAAPPLCLDPNPAYGIFMNNLQSKKHLLSTAPLRRTARKFSQVTVNRKRKLDQFTSHTTLHLHDFVIQKKPKQRVVQGKPLKKIADGCLPLPPAIPTEDTLVLTPPTEGPNVFAFAKHYEPPKDSNDCSATIVEEYVLETERAFNTIYYVKLTILQRQSNCEYLGELYVDRDYKEGVRNGSSCQFVLGTRAYANKYIQQFTEIFTEEGRKAVRITHLVPGQAPRVTCTGQRPAASAVAKVKVPNHVNAALTNPVPHLTSLLNNANTAAPPNVNVNQIQQSNLPSLLSKALSSSTSDLSLPNGPLGMASTVNTISNATVHHQPIHQHATAKSTRQFSANPEISALATSLENSSEQFLQQQAAAAQQQQAANASVQNPTILSLLNAPATTQKVARNTNVAKLVNPRTINANSGSSPAATNSTLVVNNANQQLRMTLQSFANPLQVATGQPASFTLATTQAAGITIANSHTSNQTYALSGLTQGQGQTFTLTPTQNVASAQGFTLSPAQNSQTFAVLHSNQNFTALPSVQSQTYQINSTTGAQTFTITTPVVTVSSQFPAAASSSPANNTFTPINQPVFAVNLSNKSSVLKNHLVNSAAKDGVRLSSPLRKVLNPEQSDSRLLTERHIAEKSVFEANSRLNQVLNASGKLENNSKLSQALSGAESTSGTPVLNNSMTGLRTLLAGCASADNPLPGSSASSSSNLLERLTATPGVSTSSAAVSPNVPAPSPIMNHQVNSPLPNLTSPTAAFVAASPNAKGTPSGTHVQGFQQGTSPKDGVVSPLGSPPTPVSLNLQALSLQGIAGLQNVQMSIPGFAVPISVSLNVPGQPGVTQGVLMTSLPVAATTNTTTTTSAATMVLTNSSSGTSSILSLPVAQIMASGVKNTPQRSASITIPQGAAPSIQLLPALRQQAQSAARPALNSSPTPTPTNATAAKSMQPLAARGLINTQRSGSGSGATAATANTMKVAQPAATIGVGVGVGTTAGTGQVTFSPQQIIALQKPVQISLSQQKGAITASAIANKHRRRSNAADSNK